MAEDERDEVPTSPQDARLSSLDERLRRAERVESERRPNNLESAMIARSRGMRAAQSLIGMPLGGAIIGWLIDRLLDTAPWIMLGLMFAGFAGAVWDVVKTFGVTTNEDSGK